MLHALSLVAAVGCAPQPAPTLPAQDGVRFTYVQHDTFGRMLVRTPAEGAPRMHILAIGVAPSELPEDAAIAAVDETAWARRASAGKPCWFLPGELDTLGVALAQAVDAPWRAPLIVARGQGSAMAWAAWAQSPNPPFAGLILGGLCDKLLTESRVCGMASDGKAATLPAVNPHPERPVVLWSPCPAMSTLAGATLIDDLPAAVAAWPR